MTTTETGHQDRSRPAPSGQGAVATLSLWWMRSRTRAAMAGFDERMLKDLGIGYYDARQESRKWFWQR